MESMLCKEEHPRFQRAKDARELQKGTKADDVGKMTHEEMTRATEEYLREHPQEESPQEDGTALTKRKIDEQGKESSVKKTPRVGNED